MDKIRNNNWARLLMVAVALALAFALAACGGTSTGEGTAGGSSAGTAEAPEPEAVAVRVASLKGPTSIGLVKMMDDAAGGAYAGQYAFTIAGTADEVLPGIIKGEYDIALIPANAASVLYNKTEGAVSVIDINALGVLYLISADGSVTSMADLAGRTVHMTGKGTTPEYVTNYLLSEAGLADQVTLEFHSEATELAAVLESDPAAICIAPEPYVTSVLVQNPDVKRVVSLTDEWNDANADGSALVTGVTVVRNEFLEEHPGAVAEFLAAQAASVEFVNASPAEAAPLVVGTGIVAKEKMAELAIPYCNLVCISGDEMRTALEGYLQVLYAADPASVGGTLPDDGFYATLP